MKMARFLVIGGMALVVAGIATAVDSKIVDLQVIGAVIATVGLGLAVFGEALGRDLKNRQ